MVSNSPSPYCRPRSSAGSASPRTPSIQVPSARTHVAHSEGAQHAARLGAGFLEFALGYRVGDDAGAGAQLDAVAAQRQRADQDVEIRVAVGAQPAQRAGVRAAPLAFERRR